MYKLQGCNKVVVMVLRTVLRAWHYGVDGVNNVALLPLSLALRARHDNIDSAVLLHLSSSKLRCDVFVSKQGDKTSSKIKSQPYFENSNYVITTYWFLQFSQALSCLKLQHVCLLIGKLQQLRIVMRTRNKITRSSWREGHMYRLDAPSYLS